MLLSEFVERLTGVKRSGDSCTAKCPAHEDQQNSLGVTEKDGKILIKCYAGCETKDVLTAMGLTFKDLHVTPTTKTSQKRIAALYDYRDAEGTLLYQVVRYEPKEFRQRRPDSADREKWIWNLTGVTRVLYRLPQLIEAIQTKPTAVVFVVEGEKDADNLAKLGFTATTNAGGAAKWNQSFTEVLSRAYAVFIIPDNDRPGKSHARVIHRQLPNSCILELQGLPPKGDVSDWISRGGTAEQLKELCLKSKQDKDSGVVAIESEENSGTGKQVTPKFGDSDSGTDFNVIEHPEPLRFAEAFVRAFHLRGGTLDLRRWRNEWLRYNGSAYEVEDVESIRARMYEFLDGLLVPAKDSRTGAGDLQKFKPNQRRVTEVLDALPSRGPLVTVDMPAWLDGEENERPRADRFIACQNGLVHLPTQTLHPHSASFFTTTALPFAFDPDPPKPEHFQQFLADLFGDQHDAVQLLKEWFGYAIAHDARQQKIMLLVGPKRSGKGTIARILTALLGQQNVCSPTLAGLASHFGMQSLIGKQLAIVGDARLGNRTDIAQISERLLSISGEDSQTIPRKNKVDWVGHLPVRFMILTNELPRLQDQSGALASRFLILPLHRSFYGEEDHGLFDRLSGELPGILNWALDGYERLEERGHFVQAACAMSALQELEDLSSPVGAFVRECCDVGAGKYVRCDDLFAQWKIWCEVNGRGHSGNTSGFGRDLRAATGVESKQRRLEEENGKRKWVYEGIAVNAEWLEFVKTRERDLEQREVERAARRWTARGQFVTQCHA